MDGFRILSGYQGIGVIVGVEGTGGGAATPSV
jgi:hypothetical protein